MIGRLSSKSSLTQRISSNLILSNSLVKSNKNNYSSNTHKDENTGIIGNEIVPGSISVENKQNKTLLKPIINHAPYIDVLNKSLFKDMVQEKIASDNIYNKSTGIDQIIGSLKKLKDYSPYTMISLFKSSFPIFHNYLSLQKLMRSVDRKFIVLYSFVLSSDGKQSEIEQVMKEDPSYNNYNDDIIIASFAGTIFTKNYTLANTILNNYINKTDSSKLERGLKVVKAVKEMFKDETGVFLRYLFQNNNPELIIFNHEFYLEMIYKAMSRSPLHCILAAETMVSKGFPMDQETYLDIQTRLLSLPTMDLAFQFRSKMSSFGYQPTEQIDIDFMIRLIDIGHKKTIQNQYDIIKKWVPQNVHNSMANFLIKGKVNENTMEYLDTISESNPSLIIYNAQLKGYLSLPDENSFLETLYRLIESDIKPSSETIGYIRKYLTTFKSQSKESVHQFIKNLFPDKFSANINHMLHLLGEDSGIDDTLKILTQMAKSDRDLVKNMLSQAISKYQDVKPEFWKQFTDKNGIDLDSDLFTQLFNNIKSSKILELLENIEDADIPVTQSTYVSIPLTLYKKGDLEIYNHYMGEIVKNEPNLDYLMKKKYVELNHDKYIFPSDFIYKIGQQCNDSSVGIFAKAALDGNHLDLARALIDKLIDFYPITDPLVIRLNADYIYLEIRKNHSNTIDLVNELPKILYDHLEIRLAVYQALFDNESPINIDVLDTLVNQTYKHVFFTDEEIAFITLLSKLNTTDPTKHFYIHNFEVISLQESILNNSKFTTESSLRMMTFLSLTWLNRKSLNINPSPDVVHIVEKYVSLPLSSDLLYELAKFALEHNLYMLIDLNILEKKIYNSRYELKEQHQSQLFKFIALNCLVNNKWSEFLKYFNKLADPQDQYESIDLFAKQFLGNDILFHNFITVVERNTPQPVFDKFIEVLAVQYPSLVLTVPDYLSTKEAKYKMNTYLSDSITLALTSNNHISPDLHLLIGKSISTTYYIAKIRDILNSYVGLSSNQFNLYVSALQKNNISFDYLDYSKILLIMSNYRYNRALIDNILTRAKEICSSMQYNYLETQANLMLIDYNCYDGVNPNLSKHNKSRMSAISLTPFDSSKAKDFISYRKMIFEEFFCQ